MTAANLTIAIEATVTDAQLAAIRKQAMYYATDECPADGCARVRVEPAAAWDGLVFRTDNEGIARVHVTDDDNGAVAASFYYGYPYEDEDGSTGLEVTIFAADGTVIGSQDFG